MKNIINELSWRGLIQDIVPNLVNRLKKKPITIYIGFDPTYDSLHIGNLIPIIVLIHFKKLGHNSLVLIGGATALIGDPSDKYNEREILNDIIIKNNTKSIKIQIYKLFNYYSESIELLNNFKWIKNISFLDFIREIGIHFSISYLFSKNFIKKRIKYGISFKEFSYQIIQGYDFFYLNKIKNCQLQVGGSDQWGNITSGIELIKKKTGKIVYGLTFPLITKSDGIKFSKSDKENNIWLDENKTSPYKFYQFWINISDNAAEKYIKIYTFLSKKEIQNLILEHRKNPNKKLLQNKLAKEITKWIHGYEKYKKIKNIISILFNNNIKLHNIKNYDFESIYENIPHSTLSRNEFESGIYIVDFIKKSKFLSSKNEAIRAINSRSIYINKIIITENILLNNSNLLCKNYILLQFGKKKFFIIKIK